MVGDLILTVFLALLTMGLIIWLAIVGMLEKAKLHLMLHTAISYLSKTPGTVPAMRIGHRLKQFSVGEGSPRHCDTNDSQLGMAADFRV